MKNCVKMIYQELVPGKTTKGVETWVVKGKNCK